MSEVLRIKTVQDGETHTQQFVVRFPWSSVDFSDIGVGRRQAGQNEVLRLDSLFHKILSETKSVATEENPF